MAEKGGRKMLTICVLTAKYRNCQNNCGHCGWNLKEAKRREKLIPSNKLTKGKDGLKRLIIKRKECEE